jgi:hypothetical protein
MHNEEHDSSMLSADADADDLTSDSHPKQNGDDMPPSQNSVFYATHLDPVCHLGHLSGELQRLNMQTKDEQ